MLRTPAVLPQPSPKRRKLGEDSAATGAAGGVPPSLPPPARHGAAGAAVGGAAPGGFHSPPEAVGSRNDESAGFSGVLRQASQASGGRDEWRAYLSLDLGCFASAEEAARAHDRAMLIVAGLQGPTNFPLPAAYAAAAAACAVNTRGIQGALQGLQPVAQPQQLQMLGVALRPSGWLALLDIGACDMWAVGQSRHVSLLPWGVSLC